MIKKDLSIQVSRITLVGQLFLPDHTRDYPIACLCHGIPAGTPPVPGDGGYPLLAEEICGRGMAVLIFNFRGTGPSGGNMDLWGWTEDLRAVIDLIHCLSGVDASRLALFGFSGGAAVSVCVAAADLRVSCVAIGACPADFSLLSQTRDASAYVAHFREIGAIRDQDFPLSIHEWLEGFRKVRPIDWIHRISPRPLLMIHSNDDETVGIDQGQRLFKKAKGPKEFVILDGAGHRLRHDSRVLEAFSTWVKPILHV